MKRTRSLVRPFFSIPSRMMGIVRFVFEFENDAYGVEILASEYEAFKKALL